MIIGNSVFDNNFQRSETINLFPYNINIACKHSNGLILLVKWHVLIRNKGLEIELRLTDNRPFFEVG